MIYSFLNLQKDCYTSKQRLSGNTVRQASSNQVKNLRKELGQMKLMVAELSLKNRVLKKSLLGLENPLDD